MSINDISKTSDMKYQRDFKSIPNTGNKFIDRPESSKGNSFTLNQQVQDVERKRTTIEGYDNSMNASLDQLFKPLDIQNDETEQQMFNNYNSNRGTNVTGKMEEIQKMRQSEVRSNQRPSTPDFEE